MLVAICGLIETIVSLFYTFFASCYVIGRIITHILAIVYDALLKLAAVFASLGASLYEDAKIFVLDIDYQYGHIIKMMNHGINNWISDITGTALAVSSSITWTIEETKAETLKMVYGIGDLFAYCAFGLRNSIILVGNSMWALVMCIPNATFAILRNLFHLLTTVSSGGAHVMKQFAVATLNSVRNSVSFITTVPLQAVGGLVFIYLTIRYRRFVYQMLGIAFYGIQLLLTYFIRKIFHQFRAVFEAISFVMTPCRNLLTNFWRLSPVKEESQSDPKTADAYNFCVICQDKVKSVVLLPCRHLCLCRECYKQLKRYRRECPMCREPYEYSIQVYA